MTGPLFDTHVTLDWSSSTTPSPARPRKDAIWWGVARIGRAGVRVEPPRYVRTRAAAVAALKAFLTAELRAGRRVLLGADFPFGYPAGFAAHLTGSASALAVWDWLRQAITDGADNANNRFEVAAEINARFDGVGPFWGRPAARHLPDLPAQGRARWGSDHPPERRLVEQHQRSAQPVWKLYTTGSVGGQTLMGLPALAGLREHFAGQMQVWPFETGLARPTTPLVLAEIYPSLLKPDPEPIKDAGQVRATSRAFAALDAAGGLAPLFDAVPDLSTAERKVVATEEAWILGVGHQAALKEALASTTALPDTPPAEPSATPRPAPAKVAPDDRPRRADRRKPAAPDHATPRPAERPHPAPRAYDYLRDPQEIYAKSFAIVRAETDLGDVPADLAPLIIRLVHACGMPEIVDDLVWSQDVAASGHAALAAGAPILCDCEMVARGVIRRALLGSPVVTTIGDCAVPGLAKSRGTTRSAAAVTLWQDRLAGAVVAIGNAPTALYQLLEMLAAGAPRPAAILAFPVGFVGAAESKSALVATPGGVPFLTLTGRRGGSALAAAAVNGLSLGLAGDGT